VRSFIGSLSKTFFPLATSANYRGGRKGPTIWNCFFSQKPITPVNIQHTVLAIKNSLRFP
jgi:hypothetical protein